MFLRSVLTVFVAIFAGFSSIGRGHQGASIKDLKTTAEASEFKSTST